MRGLMGILACAVALSGVAQAAEGCCPCDGCDPCYQDRNIYATLEGLCWRVNHCPIGLARRAVTDGLSFGLTNDATFFGDYDGGVRARVGRRTCTSFADISYLHFSSGERKSFALGNFDEMFVAGQFDDLSYDFVSGRIHFRYQNVDLRLGHYLCPYGCFEPFVYANVRWARVDHRRNYNAQAEASELGVILLSQKVHSRFNGGGLGLGAGGHYKVWGQLGLSGTFNVLALIGETRYDFLNTTLIPLDFPVNVTYGKTTGWDHVIPGCEFRLGLDYSGCLCSLNLIIEIGYELDWYAHMLYYPVENQIASLDDLGVPVFSCQDMGFSGPFFRLTAEF